MKMKQPLNRRNFIKTAGIGLATLSVGCSEKQEQPGGGQTPQKVLSQGGKNKREAVLSLLDNNKKQDYIPAGFFIHFGKDNHRGQAAINKHLEFFRHTGMDFIKIQYENNFPQRPEINKPEDWNKMPLYHKDFFEGQLKVTEGLIKEAKKEALVIQTLYPPFLFAKHTLDHAPGGGNPLITQHFKENPEQVLKGMEIITESAMVFVKECIKLGVDGFYASSQGGEDFRFGGTTIFEDYVKPYDMIIMEEIHRACEFNILHICDIRGAYSDLTPFVDYPCHVVNCSQELVSETLTPQQITTLFNKPYMGGLERNGFIVSGSQADIKKGVTDMLDTASDAFILGADCTLPGDINWDNIRTAISTAHEYIRS
jgi:uroporphyrinogen decarboxylase